MGPTASLEARAVLLSAALLAGALLPARAAAQNLTYGVIPETDQLFHRLLADPRQPQTTVRYYRLGGLNLADVALGNTWGMARWHIPGAGGDDWHFQLNVAGMGYSRFKLSGAVNEFQTIDFFLNFPLEVRRGRFSAQVMGFHESSHLGDDYIRRTGSTGFRYSIEGFRTVASYELLPTLRVYGGGTGLFHAIPDDQDGALQYGFEVRSKDLGWLPQHESWVYLAQDFKNYGRSGWNLNSKTDLGLRVGVPKVVRDLRVHVGYFGGRSEYGQFYKNREHYWDTGVTFDF